MFKKFSSIFEEKYSHVDTKFVTLDKNIPHTDMLATMADFRYVVVLSPCEGFGLLPLEAMSCRCLVIGFHACGGLDYLVHNVNCQVTGYPDLEGVCDMLASSIKNPKKSERLANKGKNDAMKYDVKTFDKNWLDFFKTHIPQFNNT